MNNRPEENILFIRSKFKTQIIACAVSMYNTEERK